MLGLKEFSIDSGYLESKEEETMEIPRRLEGMEAFQKQSKDFFGQLAQGIDQMFNKAHISFVPPIVRYLVCILLILSPCFAVCFMIFLDEDDEPIQEPKRVQRGAKVASASTTKAKREKIE